MVTVKRQRVWEWTIIIVALVLLGLAAWAILRPTTQPTHKSESVTSEQPETTTKKSATADKTQATSEPDQDASSTPPAPDPSTLRELPISQLGITISYDKTLPGVSYAISRTPAGTQYVDLMNDQLIGGICTNDAGTFASIIKDPTASDQATVSATVKVGDDTYGLSLPSADCTSNADLFAQFQDSIKATFPYLSASAE